MAYLSFAGEYFLWENLSYFEQNQQFYLFERRVIGTEVKLMTSLVYDVCWGLWVFFCRSAILRLDLELAHRCKSQKRERFILSKHANLYF